jgi:hypothetical protein
MTRHVAVGGDPTDPAFTTRSALGENVFGAALATTLRWYRDRTASHQAA